MLKPTTIQRRMKEPFKQVWWEYFRKKSPSWTFDRILNTTIRSSRPDVFCEKGILRNFVKFTGKHLRQGLFFNKVAGLRPATLLKKRLWCRCFPVNFTKFLRTPFFREHIWWLLLNYVIIKIFSRGRIKDFFLIITYIGWRNE